MFQPIALVLLSLGGTRNKKMICFCLFVGGLDKSVILVILKRSPSPTYVKNVYGFVWYGMGDGSNPEPKKWSS